MGRSDENCPLCGRPLGARVEAHHLVPRTFRGRETVDLHPICHRKIHATLTERELQGSYSTIEALRAQDEIARFIAWVANKDPDFHVSTFASRNRKARRRR